jgi:hypothetical protein
MAVNDSYGAAGFQGRIAVFHEGFLRDFFAATAIRRDLLFEPLDF